LRLLADLHPLHPEVHSEPLRAQEVPRPALRIVSGPPRVLVAGADACRRATLLDELTQTLPAATVFDEAGAVCEVLEHAPTSRMAVLAGDLDDAPAESVMQLLAQRHPGLAVLSVNA
jgi:hypothetical protein